MKDIKKYIIEKINNSSIDESDIPDVLYHATIKPYLPNIKKYGLGGKIPSKRYWDYVGTKYENVKQGFFLDIYPENAYYYIENADELWDDYEDAAGDNSDILLFSINKKDLDLSKLSVDENDKSNEDEVHSYFYDGVIPFSKLKRESTAEY